MNLFRGKHEDETPPGWVRAPDIVAGELRLYWQDQELAETLKDLPTYEPFHLSAEVQAWVDSMQEVRERDGVVYGLPKPKQEVEHVIRAQTSRAPAVNSGSAGRPREAAALLDYLLTLDQQPRFQAPPEPVKPLPLPVIGGGQRTMHPPSPPLAMPDIGRGGSSGRPPRTASVPDRGRDITAPAPHGDAPGMPEIGPPRRPADTADGPLPMPDIGRRP